MLSILILYSGFGSNKITIKKVGILCSNYQKKT